MDDMTRDTITLKELPPYEAFTFARSADRSIRKDYVQHISWPILTREWVHRLAEYLRDKKVLDGCAGRGVLKAWLHKLGVDIRGVDTYAYERPETDEHYHVDNMCVSEALDKWDDIEVVILSWPPYAEGEQSQDLVWKTWEHMRPGQILIYIGEDGWGCNMCYDTERALELFKIERDLVYELDSVFPRWSGIHDRIEIYKKGE